MGEMKHTPGPWVFEPHGAFRSDMLGEDWPVGYISVKPGDVLFALGEVFEGRPVAEVTANARLIAAAPELLEAVRWLRALWEPGSDHDTQEVGDALRCADAAIARATQGSDR